MPRYGNTTRVSWLCVLEGLCVLERVCVLEGCSACVSWKGVLGRIFWLCVLERLCIVEGLCVLEVCSYCVSWKDCESWKDALVNANYSPCPAPTPCFHLDISCKSLLLPNYTNKLLLTDSNVYCSRSIGLSQESMDQSPSSKVNLKSKLKSRSKDHHSRPAVQDPTPKVMDPRDQGPRHISQDLLSSLRSSQSTRPKV